MPPHPWTQFFPAVISRYFPTVPGSWLLLTLRQYMLLCQTVATLTAILILFLVLTATLLVRGLRWARRRFG